MKDKEKQIEEMAKDIVRIAGLDVYGKAEELINLGYQKVDKDKQVVLSKEDWENLCKEKNDYKQRFESSEKRYEQLVQSSCEALEKKSKETAREILDQIKFLVEERNGADIEDLSVDGTILEEILNELAKQYGVEIKE